MTDYIDLALRTKSDQFNAGMVDHFRLIDLLHHFVSVSEEFDKMKKAYFYGKRDETAQVVNPTLLQGGLTPDLLHGLLGKITETGELAVAMLKTFHGIQIDLVNVAEELGDSQWYDAIMAKDLGLSFDDLQGRNIAKLSVRFPEKFTSHLAEVRDLNAERNILENNEKAIDS